MLSACYLDFDDTTIKSLEICKKKLRDPIVVMGKIKGRLEEDTDNDYISIALRSVEISFNVEDLLFADNRIHEEPSQFYDNKDLWQLAANNKSQSVILVGDLQYNINSNLHYFVGKITLIVNATYSAGSASE